MIYGDMSPVQFAAPRSFVTDTTRERLSFTSQFTQQQPPTVFVPPPPPPERLPLPIPTEPQTFLPLPIPGFAPPPPAPQPQPQGDPELIAVDDLPPQSQFEPPSDPGFPSAPPPVPTGPPVFTTQSPAAFQELAPPISTKTANNLKPILIGGAVVLALTTLAVILARR